MNTIITEIMHPSDGAKNLAIAYAKKEDFKCCTFQSDYYATHCQWNELGYHSVNVCRILDGIGIGELYIVVESDKRVASLEQIMLAYNASLYFDAVFGETSDNDDEIDAEYVKCQREAIKNYVLGKLTVN